MKRYIPIILISIIAACFTGCNNDDDEVDTKPVAAFKIEGADAKVPKIELGDPVIFTDISFDLDGDIVEWNYDFSDGTVSNEQNPVHVYENLGSYTISLTTVDNSGQQSANVYTRDVTIIEPSFADEEPSVLWSFDIPGGTEWCKSGLSVADDGTVFVGVDGDEINDNIYAIDKDGNKKWSYKTPSGHIYGSMALSNDNSVLYGSEKSGFVFALNTEDGSAIWENQVSSRVAYCGVSLSGDEQTLYCGFYTGDNDIKAINTSDGTVKWEYDTPNGISATPAIGNDGTIYYADLYRRLYAVKDEGTSCSVVWSITDKLSKTANPIAIDYDRDVMYLGTQGNHFYAVNLSDGSIKWENLDVDGMYLNGASIADDGTVYVTSETDKMLRALDPETGNVIWEYECKDKLKAVPTIDSRGNIYLGDLSGYFYVLDKTGKDLWKTIRLSGQIWSSCAISDEGIIYVLAYDETGAGNKVYALKTDGSPLADTSWPTRGANNKRQGRK